MSARQDDESRLLLLALSVVLGVFVTAASTLMFDRGARRFDVVETQLRILKGGPAVFDETVVYLPTNQNRILVPLAVVSLVGAGNAPVVAYTTIRLLTAFAMFAGVAWILSRTRRADSRAIGAALVVLALARLPSFNYGWEQPSDFPDVLFMTWLAALAVNGRRWLTVVVAAVAAANRESAAFAGIGPVIVWLLLNRARVDRLHAGLVTAAVIISVLTLSTGLASELRCHLPAFAVLLYAAVAAECGWRNGTRPLPA